MTLKFNLNKIARIDNIEQLPISECEKLWKLYIDYLDKHEGKDILDRPNIDIGFGGD